MKQKVHILESRFYEKKTDGTPYTYISKKDGKTKSYKKVCLTLDGSRKAWGAVFSDDQKKRIESIDPNAETELEITETTKDGKIYLNFEFPKSENSHATIAQVSQLVKRIEALEYFMNEVKSGKKSWFGNNDDFNLDGEDDIRSDEIPF